MNYLKIITYLIVSIVFYSCNREREIYIDDKNELKFIVSTDYDSFEETESYYYELISKDTVLAPKTWFLGTGYKDVALTVFTCGSNDSLIYLKHLNSIIMAYDLKNKRELKYIEIENCLNKRKKPYS